MDMGKRRFSAQSHSSRTRAIRQAGKHAYIRRALSGRDSDPLRYAKKKARIHVPAPTNRGRHLILAVRHGTVHDALKTLEAPCWLRQQLACGPPASWRCCGDEGHYHIIRAVGRAGKNRRTVPYYVRASTLETKSHWHCASRFSLPCPVYQGAADTSSATWYAPAPERVSHARLPDVAPIPVAARPRPPECHQDGCAATTG